MDQQARTLETGEAIVIGGWLVDTKALQIKQANKLKKIDRRAMEVLRYLAGRQNKLVLRQELKDAIWGDTDVDDNAIDATILELQLAFEDSEKNAKIIKTVAGNGCRLIGRVTSVGASSVPVPGNPKKLESPLDDRATRAAAVNQLRANEWRIAAYLMIVLMIAVVVWLEPWGSRVEPASLAEMQSPLPDRPSIAVLPFSNPSEDPEQEILVDALTGDLITDLSEHPGLFVVDRDSIVAYKSLKFKIRDVAHSHGVRYVLKSSVRRAGVRLRIKVQLFDAFEGDRIWQETFDGVLDDRVMLQDEMARGIIAELAVN